MAYRAHLRLLLALVLLFAAQFLLRGTEVARADLIAPNATLIAQNAAHAPSAPQDTRDGVDSRMLANGPPSGGNLAAVFRQWNDDDPDDILQAQGVSISLPPLTSGFGRRVGYAVARESLVSAAFPRGPPAL
ncbi:MAG: hypothetical protein ACJ8D9_20545 [Xanthobacteraceae bacterium]